MPAYPIAARIPLEIRRQIAALPRGHTPDGSPCVWWSDGQDCCPLGAWLLLLRPQPITRRDRWCFWPGPYDIVVSLGVTHADAFTRVEDEATQFIEHFDVGRIADLAEALGVIDA